MSAVDEVRSCEDDIHIEFQCQPVHTVHNVWQNAKNIVVCKLVSTPTVFLNPLQKQLHCTIKAEASIFNANCTFFQHPAHILHAHVRKHKYISIQMKTNVTRICSTLFFVVVIYLFLGIKMNFWKWKWLTQNIKHETYLVVFVQLNVFTWIWRHHWSHRRFPTMFSIVPETMRCPFCLVSFRHLFRKIRCNQMKKKFFEFLEIDAF